MPRSKNSVPATRAKKPVRAFVYGPAPILEGENSKAYDELLASISGAVNPSDSIEDIWVNDVASMTWEILRYRRYKAALIKAAVPEALEAVIEPLVLRPTENRTQEEVQLEKLRAQRGEETRTKAIMRDWIQGDPGALNLVNDILSDLGLTMDDVNARAMALAIADIERIDSLSLRKERSRNAVLHQIECRRTAFAELLRRAARYADETALEDSDVTVMRPRANDEAA